MTASSVPAGRQVGDPYRADTLSRVLAKIREFGRILSAPTEGVCHAAGRFGNGDVFIR